jgi:hypothetical protein
VVATGAHHVQPVVREGNPIHRPHVRDARWLAERGAFRQ